MHVELTRLHTARVRIALARRHRRRTRLVINKPAPSNLSRGLWLLPSVCLGPALASNHHPRCPPGTRLIIHSSTIRPTAWRRTFFLRHSLMVHSLQLCVQTSSRRRINDQTHCIGNRYVDSTSAQKTQSTDLKRLHANNDTILPSQKITRRVAVIR